MAMYRIRCAKCGWHTKPHYSIIDCVMEKEWSHKFGIKEVGFDAHDSAFGETCPKCGGKTIEEYRYFNSDELKQ